MPTTDLQNADASEGTYDFGAALIEAAEEMITIERGERAPPVEHIYDGLVQVEVRERGELTWRLADVRLAVDPSDPPFL